MQNTYSLLLKNLSILAQATSSRQSQAEQWLENETSNNPEIHLLMRQVILDQTAPYNVRLMCSTAFNNHLINILYENQYNEIFVFARQIIRDPSYPQEFFKHLERFFIELINKVQQNYAQQWLMLFKELLNQKLITRAFLILASFAISQITDSNFIYFINLGIPWSIEAIMNMVSVNGSLCTLEWSKAMCQVLTRLLSKNDEIFVENLQIIASNPEICRVIMMVYELESSLQSGYLSVHSGLTQLNILKSSFCEVHSLILKSFQKFQKRLVQSPHHVLLIETVPRLFHTLLLAAKNFDKCNQELQCSDFIRNITRVFSYAILTNECNDIFFPLTAKIVNQVIFPALILNDAQITSFQQDNQQFIHHIEDIFYKHLSSVLKSDCAELLESLADIIDGTTTYTTTTAINSLKINLKIMEKTEGVVILTNQQAIMVLGILSCCYHERPDIAIMVGTFLSENAQVILKSFSPIQLALLYLFLGYVQNVIFPQKDDGFIYFKHSSICRVHPTTEFAALTFLSNHIQKVSSTEILKILIQRTQNCGYGLIWTILQDFLKSNINVLTEEIAIDFVNIILLEIDNNLKNQKPSSNHTIMQCINNIILMVDPKKGFLKNKPKLQATIWKIFQFFKLPKNSNTDEIVKLLNDFIKNKSIITQQIYSLFPVINERLKQNSNLYLDIFPTINHVILKSSFDKQSQEALMILEWCLTPLGIQQFRQHERAESLLLLQLFLDKYVSILSPNTIIQTMSILGQYRTKIVENPSLLRLLTTTLYFYQAPINVQHFQLLKPILSIDYSLPVYFEEYTKKLIVILLTKVLLSQTRMDILVLVLNGIITLLSNWKPKQEPRTKSKKKNIKYQKEKYLQSVSRLKSEYKKVDIFQYFSNIFNKMKLGNYTVTQELISKLSEENKNALNVLLGLRQVHREPQARKIFKIKGIKQNVDLKSNTKQTQKHDIDLEQQGPNQQQQKIQQQLEDEDQDVKVRVNKKRELKKQNKQKGKKCLTTVR